MSLRTEGIAPKLHAVMPSCRRAGFTLIELLVVLAVISVLAGLVAPSLFRNVGDAKMQAARSQIDMLGLALDAYRLDTGEYPTSEQGLKALWKAPAIGSPARWRGPYTRKEIPDDSWGRPFVYRAPGDSSAVGYDLATYGRDGKPGGDGEDADINSWGRPR